MYITLFPPKSQKKEYLLELDEHSSYLVPCNSLCSAKENLECDGLNISTHHDFLDMYKNGCQFEEVHIIPRHKNIIYGRGIKLDKSSLPADFMHTIKTTAY